MLKRGDSSTEAEKLKTALQTQDLLHQKVGRLRAQLQAVEAKNKSLRRKVLKLQQHINKLNESLY